MKEEFPTRQASKQLATSAGSPGDNKTLTRSSKSFHGKSANKYSLKEELSSEFVLPGHNVCFRRLTSLV